VPDFAFDHRGKRRFDDHEPTFAKRQRHRLSLPAADAFDSVDGLPEGDRWSTWDQPSAGERGPRPYPDWLVTELAAVDTELGILKTGKEADVFLLRRGVPGNRPLLPARRQTVSRRRAQDVPPRQRLPGSPAGARIPRRPGDGQPLVSGAGDDRQAWANAELSALCQLHQAGVPVPYPVQVLGTEVLLEFIGESDGTAAPRLADTRLRGTELAGLWDQLVQALVTLAGHGLAHGDMSAYNLLVHHGRLIMIDLPQVVDVIANPRGAEFLDRDATNIARWFSAHGLDSTAPGPGDLPALLRYEARIE
jgi:RIO kinase 1